MPNSRVLFSMTFSRRTSGRRSFINNEELQETLQRSQETFTAELQVEKEKLKLLQEKLKRSRFHTRTL